MNNVLITGATGFIGSHLRNSLHGTKFNVTAISRKSTHGFVNMGELSYSTDWSAVLNDINTVVHTAASAHLSKSSSSADDKLFFDINRDATINLARQCVHFGIKRFIFISSIGVHGNISDKPFSYLDEPSPYDAYTQSKYEAEQALKELSENSDLEVVIIRPPLVYGPNARGSFSNLMNIISKNIPLPFGAVNNSRSLVGIDNLIDLITLCLDHPAAINQTFLVSDDSDVSTSELLKVMISISGKRTFLFPVDIRVLNFFARIIGKRNIFDKLCGNLQIDISHTKNTLSWHPPVSFKEGIQRCF
ncbi:NAD-dependent epimerase/dehydratase family protein [Endozoicomonas elysicola]|uniref:Nucleoside-diphosphate sugar epimerase n=1 Tax=Endozoicomonas elysicola TaxID=305900 RepID=A0A081KCS1_9GAMM|nr:NAD-dependent epimerase/dehydratase family protein [Endozoicomonas elysicola]KEI71947.1 nucleoside-diphosphate sugar epimerase [Endozoicomonas elysicola]